MPAAGPKLLAEALFRLLLTAILAVVAWLLIRKLTTAGASRPPAGRPDRGRGRERLVRCSVCGTAVPESRLLPAPSGEELVCSRECGERVPR